MAIVAKKDYVFKYLKSFNVVLKGRTNSKELKFQGVDF